MKNTRSLLKAGAFAILLLVGASSAHAARYLLTYAGTSAPLAASLTFTTSNVLNAVSGYNITGLSGNVAGDLVAALTLNPNQPNAATSTDGLFTFDNVLFASAPRLDNDGALFTGVSGIEYNLFSLSPTSYQLYEAQNGVFGANSIGTVSVSAVPEPATWALMIFGIGAVGVIARRRKVTALAI